MINYIEKGSDLHKRITEAGHWLIQRDGVWVSDDDTAVQTIIDAYDPLPPARAEAIGRVKQSAANKYGEYASAAPGKDAVYAAKQLEAQQHAINAAIGPYMQARINKTGETAAAIAAEWSAKSTAWNALAAQIDAIQDNATAQINTATDWTVLASLADAAASEIEALG